VIRRAEALSKTIGFWFRQRYGLAPTDPVYLAMTEEEMVIELEAVMAAKGEARKECPDCAVETFLTVCPECGLKLSGDKVMDDVLRRLEAGEDVDLDEELRGESFAPVELNEGGRS